MVCSDIVIDEREKGADEAVRANSDEAVGAKGQGS